MVLIPARLTVRFHFEAASLASRSAGPCSSSLTGVAAVVQHVSNAQRLMCQARTRMAYFGLLLVELVHGVKPWELGPPLARQPLILCPWEV